MNIEIMRIEGKMQLIINNTVIADVIDYKIISSADGTTELMFKTKNVGAQITVGGMPSTGTVQSF